MAGQWTQMSDFPGAGRHRASTLTIGNKGYLGFGHINGTGVDTYFNDWWEYDPATDSWTQKASFPWHGSNVWSNMLDCNGFEISGIGYIGKSSSQPFYQYSPATNVWTELNSLPINTSVTFSDPLVIGNEVYSFSNDDSLKVYHSISDSWTADTSFHVPEPSVIYEYWKNVYSLNGVMYFTKWSQQDQQYDFWKYNVLNNEWTFLGEWLPIFWDTTVFEHQGNLIAACGGMSSPYASNDVYAYIPESNIWMQLEAFPGSGRRYPASFTINGIGYMSTGTNGVNFSDLWKMTDILRASERNAPISMDIFPNPVTDHVTFESKKISSFELNLFNNLGECVGSKKTSNGYLRFERNELEVGPYYYEVISEGEIIDKGALVFN